MNGNGLDGPIIPNFDEESGARHLEMTREEFSALSVEEKRNLLTGQNTVVFPVFETGKAPEIVTQPAFFDPGDETRPSALALVYTDEEQGKALRLFSEAVWNSPGGNPEEVGVIVKFSDTPDGQEEIAMISAERYINIYANDDPNFPLMLMRNANGGGVVNKNITMFAIEGVREQRKINRSRLDRIQYRERGFNLVEAGIDYQRSSVVVNLVAEEQFGLAMKFIGGFSSLISKTSKGHLDTHAFVMEDLDDLGREYDHDKAIEVVEQAELFLQDKKN